MYKLSELFTKSFLIRDGVYHSLGGHRTELKYTLAYADNEYYLRKLINNDNISCLIIKNEMIHLVENESIGLVVSDNPRNLFYQTHNDLFLQGFYKNNTKTNIGNNAKIHKSAQISENNVTIEDNVIINENCVIKDNVHISSGAIIQPGVVVGADGILYMKLNNRINYIKHAGNVYIGREAVILANAVLVKSVFPTISTVIKDRTIVGVASNIGHEAFVGNDCVISGNCVVARNVIIGDRCLIGTSSVIRENIEIGCDAKVFAGAIVISNVQPGESVSGNFAKSHIENLKQHIRLS